MHANTRLIARVLLLAAPLALAGCLSFTSDNARPPPQNTTVVVPPASGGTTTTVVCANGAPPPCN